MSLVVRVANRDEVNLATEWAAREGWNPGLHDADVFYATGPEGFFVAEEAGEVVGTVSAFPFGESFGFIGFFIVAPEHRSHQVGIELGQRALDFLMGRNVGIDGVEAKVHTYGKLGFELAHKNIRMECPGDASLPAFRCVDEEPGVSIVPVDDVDWSEIAAWDRRCFGFDREKFLMLWVRQPEGRTLAAVRDGNVVGFGKTRPCRQGYKFGPLFASSPAIAESLYLELRAGFDAGQPHYLDLPEPNQAAVKMAKFYGMTPCFQTTRMYSGGDPGLPLNEIFGITSFELG